MNKKVLAIMFLIAIVIVSGVTYAWYSWTSTTNTLVTFNIQGATVTYNASDITKDLMPTATKENTNNVIETITVIAPYEMYFTLELELATLEAGLKDVSFKYEVYEGGTKLTSGNFSTFNQDDVVTLLNRSIINTTERTLTLYIWIDGNMSNPTTMQNQDFSFKLRANATDNPVVELPYNGSEYIQLLAATNTDEIRTVTHEAITENTATGSTIPAVTDYRYYGENPNNYIIFNGETWRVIGVFYDELTDSNRIKIIKADSIATMAWDTADATYPDGSNDWTSATLNSYLNGDYYTGLLASAKVLISNARWYLGSPTINTSTLNTYLAERGNTSLGGNTTYWEGKIGLMYPSDYGYAANSSCVENNTLGYDLDTGYNPCYITDWLYSNGYPWTLSANAVSISDVFNIFESGDINVFIASDEYSTVRPVLYLTPEVEIVDGDGSFDYPFEIS